MIVYTEGDVENGAIPVGQTVGLIDSILDVDDIISGFTKEAEKMKEHRAGKKTEEALTRVQAFGEESGFPTRLPTSGSPLFEDAKKKAKKKLKKKAPGG